MADSEGQSSIGRDREPSRYIPENIKREVRQKSGFGCVICGELPYEYEHIVPWSECREHTVENIVLLCGKHHREVTSGRLSKGAIRRAQAAPFALRNGKHPYYSFLTERQRFLHFGGNYVDVSMCEQLQIVRYRNKPMIVLDFENGVPLLSMNVLNLRGRRMLRIERNEVIFGVKNLWDVSLSGTNLSVRKKNGTKLLVLEIAPGKLTIKHLDVKIGKSQLLVTAKKIKNDYDRKGPNVFYGNRTFHEGQSPLISYTEEGEVDTMGGSIIHFRC